MSATGGVIEKRETRPAAARRAGLRVLVSAYTISPCRGSEPAGGWQVCVRLARHHDVHVLCSPNVEGEDYRSEIEQYLKAHGGIDGLTIHYVEPPLMSRMLQRPGGTLARLFYYAGYRAWQKRALAAARQLLSRQSFDMVHQLNMTGFREPGYLWRLGLPFVWGPIGGACRMPWSYFRLLSVRDRVLYGVRNVATELQRRFAWRVGKAARAAGRVWHISESEGDLIRSRSSAATEQMLDSGTMAEHPLAWVRRYDGRERLRLVWSGVHIGRKALPILLHAISRLPERDRVRLDVLWDGLLTKCWKSLAVELGVADLVQWHGRLPHAQAMERMSQGHALAFTSLLEGSPHVVVEALSLGLPVICHDACGMGVAVTEDCGEKVALRTLEGSICGFADSVAGMMKNPDRVERLSEGALLRARELSWDEKVRQVMKGYEQVLKAAGSWKDGRCNA